MSIAVILQLLKFKLMQKVIIIIVISTILFGCKNGFGDQYAGNKEMSAILDSCAKNAIAQDNYAMNTQRAEQLKNTIEITQDPNQKISMTFQYGNELLNSGNTEEASKVFLQLIETFGGAGKPMNANTKLLYELLAITYLREGELKNCVLNHTSSSCIVPLKAAGFHRDKSGSEKAIEVYKKILIAFPNDYQSIWLLNIAYKTLGVYPAGVPKNYLIPPTKFEYKGTLPSFNEIAMNVGLDINGLSGGNCLEDFNNDGFIDVFMTSYGLTDQCRYFQNKGDGTFIEKTEEAKLTGLYGGLNTVHADYNNDGNVDIFILRGGWLRKGGNIPNSLLRNNGDGTFSDVTKSAGVLTYHPTQTASFADYDGDGNLDLFVGNESTSDNISESEFYHNNGDGTFEEVSASSGLLVNGFVKGVNWGDINNDNQPDLYVSMMGQDNQLWVNREGKFTNIATTAGVTEPKMSFPTWFFDYDNDGYQDIFVCGYDSRRLELVGEDMGLEMMGKAPKGELCKLYHNNGNETFTDVSKSLGLNKIMYTMGSNFGDLDNDGYLDMYCATGSPDYRSISPNRMFRNMSGKSFEEVTMAGFGHLQKGHGVSWADIDNDGDEDIYTVMGGAFQGDHAFNVLFENPGTTNKWVQIKLKGDKSNRMGIGSVIKVKTTQMDGSKKDFYKTVTTGGSFGSNSLNKTIGLGDTKSIDALEVNWQKKGGKPIVYNTGIALNSSLEINEGEAKPLVLKNKKIVFNKIPMCKPGSKH
jgi:FG-GAP-like repeat/ASPIC and UnbV